MLFINYDFDKVFLPGDSVRQDFIGVVQVKRCYSYGLQKRLSDSIGPESEAVGRDSLIE
jgi:hypothetical protein